MSRRLTKTEPASDITDADDIVAAAREFVERSPLANLPAKLILHMAAEIETLRRDIAAHRRRANSFRRRLAKAHHDQG